MGAIDKMKHSRGVGLFINGQAAKPQDLHRWWCIRGTIRANVVAVGFLFVRRSRYPCWSLWLARPIRSS